MEETIKRLISRFWPTGVLFLGGFVLIIYIALGFLYFQQGAKQGELEEQIVQLSAVVARPFPSSEELQAEYEERNSSLAPITDVDAIAMLVSIAEKSGIDTNPDSDKFQVRSGSFDQAVVGGNAYQLLSFRDITVQGDYDNVMAFISDLDSGETLKTMVLKWVTIRQIEVQVRSEEPEEVESSGEESEGAEGSSEESEEVESSSAEPEIKTKIETVATLDVDIYIKPEE